MGAVGRDPGMAVLATQLKRRAHAQFQSNLLLTLGGAGSIALGLAYVHHAFGPTEAEVVLWGRISIWLGLTLFLLTVGFRHSKSRAVKGLLGLGWGIVALLQLPPILLWLALHGSGISDGTPPSAFVAHWAYAIPHVAVLAASAATVWSLLMQPTCGSRSHGQLFCLPNASKRPEING